MGSRLWRKWVLSQVQYLGEAMGSPWEMRRLIRRGLHLGGTSVPAQAPRGKGPLGANTVQISPVPSWLEVSSCYAYGYGGTPSFLCL